MWERDTNTEHNTYKCYAIPEDDSAMEKELEQDKRTGVTGSRFGLDFRQGFLCGLH